jgi:hypothetical protein
MVVYLGLLLKAAMLQKPHDKEVSAACRRQKSGGARGKS